MICTRLSGTYREMGDVVGRAHALAISRVAAERMRAYHTANCDVCALERLLDNRIEQVSDLLPDTLEYLEGIALGSLVPLQRLVLFNFGLSDEEAQIVAVAQKPEGGAGCTIAAFQNAPEGPVIGGNLDDPPWQFISLDRPQHGYKSLQVRLPGYFATWGGMNERGLCITGASGGPALPGTLDAVPDSPRPPLTKSPVQDVLYQCSNVDEAVALLQGPLFAGNNYMLGDSEQAVQVEKRYDGVTVTTFREPEDAPLCAGNLRRSDLDQPWYAKHLNKLPPDKLARHRLVRSLMQECQHRPGVAALQAVLNDHGAGQADVGASHSLCHVGSALTLVGIPRQKRVLIAQAPACVNDYTEYMLDEVLSD